MYGTAGLLLGALALLLALAGSQPAYADLFDQTLAEIDRALETNPNGVPEESLRSCRAMRKTAVLLHDMGRVERAFRRLKSCRQLLGLEGYPSSRLQGPELQWVG